MDEIKKYIRQEDAVIDWNKLLQYTDKLSYSEARHLYKCIVDIVENETVSGSLHGVVKNDDKSLKLFRSKYIDNGRWVERISDVLTFPNKSQRLLRRSSSDIEYKLLCEEHMKNANQARSISQFRYLFHKRTHACFVKKKGVLKDMFPMIDWNTPTSTHKMEWAKVDVKNLNMDLKLAIAFAAKNVECMSQKVSSVLHEEYYNTFDPLRDGN